MPTAIRDRVAEISEKLAPVLAELKLKPIVRNGEHARFIQFVSTRRRREFSPVAIAFDYAMGTEDSWRNARLEIEVWGCRLLGDTGYSSWKCYETDHRGIEGEGAKMFDWLEFAIRYHGVVPPLVGTPNCIANPNFGDLYQLAERWVPDVEIQQYYGERSSVPLEIFKFENNDGEEVQISMWMTEGDALVHVDGMRKASFSQWDHVRFNDLIREMPRKPRKPYGLR